MDETSKQAAELFTTQIDTCGLGRSLGDCSLRSAGCERLYDVLVYLYPPWEIIAEMRQRNDLTPVARAWVRRLGTITDGVN